MTKFAVLQAAQEYVLDVSICLRHLNAPTESLSSPTIKLTECLLWWIMYHISSKFDAETIATGRRKTESKKNMAYSI